MSEETPRPGLRDRKRAATRARIEAAAIELVLRDGLDAATVDAISERADISPRTFFNYFESKDAAILGLKPQALDEDDLAAQLAAVDHLDPIRAVVALIVDAMGVAQGGNADLHEQRVEVMRCHPELVGSQFSQLHARKNRLVDHVRQLLVGSGRFSDDADLTGRAVIVLAACASAVRAAVETWAAGPAEGTTTDSGAPDEVDLIQQRALALIHSTMGELL
jgi:AcrR family transcriptional regulator